MDNAEPRRNDAPEIPQPAPPTASGTKTPERPVLVGANFTGGGPADAAQDDQRWLNEQAEDWYGGLGQDEGDLHWQTGPTVDAPPPKRRRKDAHLSEGVNEQKLEELLNAKAEEFLAKRLGSLAGSSKDPPKPTFVEQAKESKKALKNKRRAAQKEKRSDKKMKKGKKDDDDASEESSSSSDSSAESVFREASSS